MSDTTYTAHLWIQGFKAARGLTYKQIDAMVGVERPGAKTFSQNYGTGSEAIKSMKTWMRFYKGGITIPADQFPFPLRRDVQSFLEGEWGGNHIVDLLRKKKAADTKKVMGFCGVENPEHTECMSSTRCTSHENKAGKVCPFFVARPHRGMPAAVGYVNPTFGGIS